MRTRKNKFDHVKKAMMETAKTKNHQRKKPVKKWSARVTKTSDAMDLKNHIFENDDPAEIARSLKKSATDSKRKKGTAFQSAMSMLNFYINRAGHNLSASRKETLEKAKDELRKVFGRQIPAKSK